VLAAVLAASCCILPLVLILTGLAGASIMMSMMRFEWVALPLGAAGLLTAWALYFRERRRCQTQACRFVGQRMNRVMLAVSTVVVAIALLLRLLPSWTAAILQSIT